MDFPDCLVWIDDLVLQRKLVANSIIGFDLLLVHDGGIECLELDLFHRLVAGWTIDILWLQPKKQQVEFEGSVNMCLLKINYLPRIPLGILGKFFWWSKVKCILMH